MAENADLLFINKKAKAQPMNKHVPKVGLVQLGCPKNLVDSERILTSLRAEGYKIAPGYDDADVVIVNTCGFLDSAKAESLAAIGWCYCLPSPVH